MVDWWCKIPTKVRGEDYMSKMVTQQQPVSFMSKRTQLRLRIHWDTLILQELKECCHRARNTLCLTSIARQMTPKCSADATMTESTAVCISKAQDNGHHEDGVEEQCCLQMTTSVKCERVTGCEELMKLNWLMLAELLVCYTFRWHCKKRLQLH